MPPFESFIVRTERGDGLGRKRPAGAVASELVRIYERVKAAGGHVVFHELIELSDHNGAPTPQLVLIADIPEARPTTDAPEAQPSAEG